MDSANYRDSVANQVIQLMDEANARRVVPNPRILRYEHLGEESSPVEGTENNHGTTVFRHAAVNEDQQGRMAKSWYYGPNLVHKLHALCQNRGPQNAFAYRPMLRVGRELVKDPESGAERPFDVVYYDNRRYITYEKLWTSVENFGCGLLDLGLSAGTKVAMYLDTRWEWMASAYGVWSQSMTLATVYANLGYDALCEAFAETRCGAIVTVAERIPTLLQMMDKGEIPPAVIIYLDGPPKESFSDSHIPLIAWEDVVNNGMINAHKPNHPTDSDQLALIMYTSGTTGGPKGVMHTHGSLAAGLVGLGERLNDQVGPVTPNENYLAALPMAHIFEFAVANVFLARGALIGFGNPRTFLSTYARPCGDYEEYKPIFLIGVPRIFDTIKKAVENQLPPRGSLERRIFDHAFQSRLRSLEQGMETPYWNEVVFAPFRKMVGGEVRAMFGGGAPISAATQTFMNVVVGNFTQGWGLTETVANGAKQLVGDLESNCVGRVERCCELKFVDTEDYKHTDFPEPRGEIYLRGPFMFKGYFKKEQQTQEVLNSDGWFRTGDIGSIADRGRLRIISRIKSLAKNTLGEYIAMEALESLYAQCPLALPNGVAVIVQPSKNYICAIVITQEAFAMKFAQQHRIDGVWPSILKNHEFQSRASELFREVAQAAGRGSHEVVRRVRVVDDVWTPENNVLTAAGKLRRGEINERYKDVIRELFVE